MTRDELYINSVKADLGKTDITLSYKSNLLMDISKIVSNSSYTIKLPKTAKNMALIECSHIPSSTSRYPYLKHKGKVLRNGIEIIKDANVVLLATGESIEIALTWGNVTNFASVVNDGKKLMDIIHGTEEGVDWVVWNNKGSNSAQFPLIDYGFNSGDPNVWYRPVVTVKWILDKIQEESGVAFNFPADKLDFIKKMIVPLFTNNDSQKINDAYPMALNAISYDSSIIKFEAVGDSTQQYVSTNGNREIYPKFDSTLKLKGTIEIFYTYSQEIDYLNTPLKITVYSTPTKQEEIIEINKPAGYITPPYIRLVYSIETSVKVYKEGYFIISSGNGKQPISRVSGNLSVTISEREGGVLLGEKLPLVPNLPDIKQIDFIKAIASMVGLFALPDGTNGIKFIPFDNLSANKSKAVDWTNKVIMAYKDVTPREIKYSLDNIAQNNWFRYKEDDKVTGNYDGNIQVEDATIEYERDAITLPFSACDTKNGVAYIPLYSYNDKGELQYNKANPRILLLDGTKGIFKGLEWTTLIANNYQTYKGLINDAKVVTEYIRLNSIELRDLEMDVPVYLAQYGCYLAIIEIKTKENDICECKLLKL